MARLPDSQAWRWTVVGVTAAVVVVVVGALTGHIYRDGPDDVDCAKEKCVALTFDDGPGPYTDRLLQILKDNDAKATFFEIGNKVAANPEGAKRVVEAGMELGSHTWEHPNMTTIPPEEIPAQFSKASDAIEAATGRRPKLVRTAGGLVNDQVLAEARKQGLADINWDVIPFDWANDANIAATRYMLMTQIRPNNVVLFHDTYSSTVDLVEQFIPVLKANGYHLVTVSHMLGEREPGTSYGSRENAPPVPPAEALKDIPPEEIPALPATPSPPPMPNFPITDIPGANSGGPNNGA
ncbi:polysaccharide deacetylase family protein [Mycobacterium sp. 48b]|uniref:polysaccharide deacetylase family protein n=1 Tax=Mycobacterium sp. 48b TaxID=3400426 RepID=UPI003AAB89ED